MKVVIRADGSHKIGMGHIYRSLILSEEFKKNNCEVFFLTKKPPAIKKFLKNKKHLIITDKAEMRIIQSINPEIIMVDKRIQAENNQYLKLLKQNCKILVTLDDERVNKTIVDISIKGFNYFILRPNFIGFKKQYKLKKKVKTILVVQGGADSHGILPVMIRWLNDIKPNFEIMVILGPLFKHHQELNKSLSGCRKKVSIYKNSKNIGKLMIKSDLVITAGGMTLLELCYLGIPSITVNAEKFEDKIAQKIEKIGVIMNLGYYKNVKKDVFVQKVEGLINNFQKRKQFSIQSRKIVDENGAKRIVEKILAKTYVDC